MEPSQRPDFARVFVPKASDVLAERLREHILGGGYAEGTPLPTERELVAQSGLSRASVREALRVLEVEGLVETRPGRNGGSVVRRPGHESVSRSVELFLRSHGIRFEALLETREAIEPATARLAAMHRTDGDLHELRALQQALEAAFDNVAQFVRVNLDWHVAVVRASHNEPLIAFMKAISKPLHAATEIESINTDDVRHAVIKAHQRVLQAISERDPEAAARRMQRHVGAYADLVRDLAAANGRTKG